MTLALTLAVSVATVVDVISRAKPAGADVVTNSGNSQRTGWYSNQPSLSPGSVSSSSFGRLGSLAVTGQVYAQPVIANNTMVVATEHNMTYGYNVSAAQPTQTWSRSLGDPTLNPKGCNDINPEIGVTSTPVIDSATGTVYVMSNAYTDASHAAQSFYLHALDISTGAERANFPVEIKGNADNDPAVAFNAAKALQRPGLLLMNGVVYAGFAGHCDAKPFQGWIAGVSTAGALTALWSDETSAGVAADGPGGGIWMSGSGLMSDQSGDIVFTTGNGTPPPTGPADQATGTLGQSLVRLRVQGDGSLKMVDYFAPYDASTLNESDSDVGSGGVVALPASFGTAAHPRLLVNVGKQGTFWLTDATDLGGVGQGADGADAGVVSRTDIQGGVRGKPTVWGGDGGYIYVASSQSGAGDGQLKALKYGVDAQTGNPSLTDVGGSKTVGDQNSLFGFGSGSPVITSSGSTSGSALIWTVWFPPSAPAGQTGVGAQLRAYDPVPVNKQLVLRKQFAIGTGTKFSVPAVNNGRLYLGTADGHVLVFGSPVAAPLQGPDVTFPTTTVGGHSTASATLTTTTALTLTAAPTVNNAAYQIGMSTPAPGTTIPAGGTVTVPLTFSPTAAGGSAATLSFTTSAGPYALSLSGTGRDVAPTLHQDSCCAAFGGITVGTSTTDQVVLSNAGAGDLQITGYQMAKGDPSFSVSGLPAASAQAPAVLHSGQSVTATFTFAPTSTGLFSDTFRILSNDPTATGDDGAAGSVSLSGSAGSPAQITVTPSTVAYGGVQVGATVIKKFTISNPGGTDLSLSVSKPPGGYGFTPGTSVPEGTVIKAGASLNVNVAFTPTAAGAASDTWEIGGTSQGRQIITFTGTGTTPAAFTASAPPNTATVGVGYSYAFAASGSPAPSFSVSAGALPAGLTLSTAGLLSGTPTIAGTSSFTVQAKNNVGPTPATAPVTFTVSPPPTTPSAPVFTAGAPSLGKVGAAYSYFFGASGFPTPAYTVASGTLPPGLTLTAAGRLQGTPTAAGSYPFTVQASNGVVPAATASVVLVISPAGGIAPQLTPVTPATATVGTAYSFSFPATGTPAPSITVIAGTVPPGLSVSATGTLSGTPTKAGNYAFTLSAANGTAPDATLSVSVSVVAAAVTTPPAAAPPVTNPPAPAPPSGTVPTFSAAQPPAVAVSGVPYAYQLAADGDPAPTYSVATGSLPPGLGLTAAGVLSGTPTTPGTYVFTVQAHNSAGDAFAAGLVITVVSPVNLLPSVVRGPIPALGVVRLHVSSVPNATVFGNLTVVKPGSTGYASVYPCASKRPVSSSVNFAAGKTTSNFASVATDANGDICIFTLAKANLIWDQVAQSSQVAAHGPQRLLDTRAPGRTVAASGVVRLHVSAVPNATVFGNFTVVAPQSTGYASAYPCAAGRPNASNVNFAAHQTTSNFAAIASDGAGNICLYTTARANIIWDQVAETSAVAAHNAQRVLDTRAPGRLVAAGHVSTVHVSAVPNATVFGNLTVVSPRSTGYAVAYPCAAGRPNSSNVNFAAGQTRSNFAAVAADSAGNICIYSASAANFVFDEVAQTTAVSATNAVRLLDTR